MIAVGLLLLFGVAVLTAAAVVGGAEMTEVHIAPVMLEGSTTAFFFMGAGTALATVVGVGCLVVGFARRRAPRSRSDWYADDPDPHHGDAHSYPGEQSPYPGEQSLYPHGRDPYPDDGQVGPAGHSPAQPHSEWTEYGNPAQGRRPRRPVPRDG